MTSLRLLCTFCLAAALAPAQTPSAVKITQDADRIHVEIGGKPFTDFVERGGEAMKPYLYPLRAADGTIITRHFPMETVEGEPTDHPHQRGLWFGHESVNGNDFWNNETSYVTSHPKRGWIKVDKITAAKGGATSGTISAVMTWSDLAGNKLVEENRTMTFRGDANVRIIDFDIVLTAATQVKFGDAKDGVFGMRLARELQESASGRNDTLSHTGVMTNAEGMDHEKAVWGKMSNWVDYSGEVGGDKVGVAIFDHPSNKPRAIWHSRGYGLFALNPFGRTAFNKELPDGSVTLDAGGKLHFQYRVVIHQGDAKSAGIAKMWDEYVK